MNQQLLDNYVNEGRLKCNTKDDLSLYCYTQDEFFSKSDWDDVTLSHRGKLYKDNQAINHPFKKIFNLNEHESTKEEVVLELLKTEPYYVLDKCNGHLFFVSAYKDENDDVNFVYHTKACIDPTNLEMLSLDIELFKEKHESLLKRYLISQVDISNMTLMLESIADYDKHTMYDIRDSKIYGENCFVLLGTYFKTYISDWTHLGYASLRLLSGVINSKICEKYNIDMLNINMHDMFDHKDREGYVVWFPNIDFRFKIKTKQYWALRMKKEFTVDRIVGIYRAGGLNRLKMRLPEEIYYQIEAILLNNVKSVYYADMLSRVNPNEYALMSNKELYTSDLEPEEKNFIRRCNAKESHDRYLTSSVAARETYEDNLLNHNKFRAFKEDFENSLQDIVDNM